MVNSASVTGVNHLRKDTVSSPGILYFCRLDKGIPHIKLSELNRQVAAVIDRHLSAQVFWVVADVTNHSFKEKSNYHYFDLVEKSVYSADLVAKIAGKAWGSGSQKIAAFERVTGQRFTNNIHVLVRVKVVFHVVYGLSLEVQDIDPSFTLGMLEQQRQATLALLLKNNPAFIRLEGERYTTHNSALPLPAVIQRIAVVSSRTSAGNQDFRHTLEHNRFGYHFIIDDYHTMVQNEANADLFLDSLVSVFTSGNPYDVVVINRGGGAQTDFLLFDNYQVGLAVAKFPSRSSPVSGTRRKRRSRT